MAFGEASDTFPLILTNAALGLAVLVGAGITLYGVVKHFSARRRRFARTVREVEAEARAMFRSGRP